jgi:hypothetical protein
LNAGWGVNAMIATFTDGHIQTGQKIESVFLTESSDSIEAGKQPIPSFALVIEVPTDDCEQVRDFVRSYVLHPAKPWKNFGLLPNPLKFEGGGCGSFAVSALSNAPSLAPLMDTYWRTLPIPEKLLGLRTRVFLPNEAVPFSYAKMSSAERPISKYKLILKNWDSGRPAFNLRLVDPELTIYSLRKFAEIARQSAGESSLTRDQIENHEKTTRIYNFGGAAGGDGSPSDNPIDNKDTGYQEIDQNFDLSFAEVSSSVDSWWSQHRSQMRMHVVSIPYGVGVLVDARP